MSHYIKVKKVSVHMKNWISRLFSNKYLKGAVICCVAMILIFILGFAFLLLIGPAMPAVVLSMFADLLAILITILAIIVTVLIIIMWIRLVIYGTEVQHDKSYWEHKRPDQEELDMETENNFYLLPIRHRSLAIPFVIGYIIISVLVGHFYLHFTFSNLGQMIVFVIIEYVLIVLIVIIVRLVRRFTAFRVKKNMYKGARNV